MNENIYRDLLESVASNENRACRQTWDKLGTNMQHFKKKQPSQKPVPTPQSKDVERCLFLIKEGLTIKDISLTMQVSYERARGLCRVVERQHGIVAKRTKQYASSSERIT